MTRHIIETIGGVPSEADNFSRLIEYLRLAEEDARELAKFQKIKRNDSLAFMWQQIADNMSRCQAVVSHLANSRTRSSAGYRSGKKSAG